VKSLVFALSLAATLPVAISAPVAAQSSSERYRFDEAQRRYDRETRLYQQARDRYEARGGRVSSNNTGYNNGRYADDRDERGYDASRDYRDGSNYQERQLAADDRVYRGSDGRYYCKRNDGTTGLIIGAVGGGILGNVIDGGHSRAAGTLIGGALGALAGRSVERSQSVRCK
jgi:Glycine zipper 2TM domain